VSYNREIFDRFTGADSYTWSITHYTESAGVWNWSMSGEGGGGGTGGSRDVPGRKCCDNTTTTTTTTTTNNNKFYQHSASEHEAGISFPVIIS
jgi:hypothetical protein